MPLSGYVEAKRSNGTKVQGRIKSVYPSKEYGNVYRVVFELDGKEVVEKFLESKLVKKKGPSIRSLLEKGVPLKVRKKKKKSRR